MKHTKVKTMPARARTHQFIHLLRSGNVLTAVVRFPGPRQEPERVDIKWTNEREPTPVELKETALWRVRVLESLVSEWVGRPVRFQATHRKAINSKQFTA